MNVARIRGGHGGYEWATICWQGWQGWQANGNDGKPRECGEILIHSSFGSWAYQWGHLGMPFDQWLQKAERGYCAEKLLGTRAREFDGEASVKALRQSLLEHRRSGDIAKNDARSIWDWIEDNDVDLESGSEEFFVTRLYDCAREADWEDEGTPHKYHLNNPGRGARHFLDEPYNRPCRRLNRQFEGFWRDLWPVFVEQLKEKS